MLVIIKKEKKEDINDVHEYIKSPKKIIHRQRRCVADSNCHFSYDPLSSKSNSLPPANPHIKKKKNTKEHQTPDFKDTTNSDQNKRDPRAYSDRSEKAQVALGR